MLFVLFDACSIGLFYEYSPPLRTLFLILFHIKKKKSDFF